MTFFERLKARKAQQYREAEAVDDQNDLLIKKEMARSGCTYDVAHNSLTNRAKLVLVSSPAPAATPAPPDPRNLPDVRRIVREQQKSNIIPIRTAWDHLRAKQGPAPWLDGNDVA